jgi:rhodanese-related sulfurtransferase
MAGSEMRASLLRAVLIVVGATLVALFVNGVSPKGLPLWGSASSVHWSKVEQIGLDTAKELFEKKAAVFVDSRDKEEFAKGHIKGAFSLPTAQFDHHAPLFMDLVPLTTPVVTYCSGQGCDSSTELAELLIGSGYKNVKVFYGGWQHWREAGYPVEGSLEKP